MLILQRVHRKVEMTRSSASYTAPAPCSTYSTVESVFFSSSFRLEVVQLKYPGRKAVRTG